MRELTSLVRYGAVKQTLKGIIKGMKIDHKFKARDLVDQVTHEMGCEISSHKIAMSLSKISDNAYIRRVQVPMDADDWQVLRKAVML